MGHCFDPIGRRIHDMRKAISKGYRKLLCGKKKKKMKIRGELVEHSYTLFFIFPLLLLAIIYRYLFLKADLQYKRTNEHVQDAMKIRLYGDISK